MFMNDYKTVQDTASDEIAEKKSRFIASVAPCATEAEAIAFLNDVKKRFSDAAHNVYAYVCRDNNSRRYSDDGEPQGTAGIPVLDVILKENLTDICVVVTRYFGGTLLGAGGLVRAYTKAAKAGIYAARPIHMVLSDIYTVKTDYSDLGKLQYEIAKNGYAIKDTVFDSVVTLIISAETARSGELVKNLTECTCARAEITKTDTCFIGR